jgi:hypothetical protein
MKDVGYGSSASSVVADPGSKPREAVDKIVLGATQVLSFNTPKPLALKTLMTERQLQDCGLDLVGQKDVQQWLVPRDMFDVREDAASPSWFDDFLSRITDLREIAKDEEGLFNEESAKEGERFASKLTTHRRPSVFLVANGNLRLLWASDAGEQIGLQFIGNSEVQYVLMARRDEKIATVMGVDRVDAIMRYINAAGLAQLFRG